MGTFVNDGTRMKFNSNTEQKPSYF